MWLLGCDVVLLMDGDGVAVGADVCVGECVVDEGGKSCWVEGECLRGKGERSATGKRRVAELTAHDDDGRARINSAEGASAIWNNK